ncbi:MAG: aldo/keto reductase, partial [Bifidobacteriaceae bacterium]|nr:aldo/keto reductase [Bifidobacteriaceae bacterium]
ASGKAKAIGISNFHKVHIASLLEKAEIKPAVNQIKISPGVLQAEVSKDTKQFGIDIEAYSPLDKGIAASNAILEKIALEIGKTSAQIALRWNLQKGNIVLPKASSLEHAKSNLDLFDFSLSDKDMELIDRIQSPDSKVPDPDSMLDN